MSDPRSAGGRPRGDEQPSEEEVRAYLGQMRQAPAGQIVAEVVSALLNAAQVKLGRRDARLLIDLASDLTETSAPHLEGSFVDEVRRVISQLQMGQVEAEREMGQARAEGREVREDNDLGAPVPGDDREQPQPSQPPPAGAQDTAASRLWIPGRP